MPKFLDKLNIGGVYIAGDTLIYCTVRQTLHSVNEKCLDSFFFRPQLGKERIAERDGGGACFNTGTVLDYTKLYHSRQFNNELSN